MCWFTKCFGGFEIPYPVFSKQDLYYTSHYLQTLQCTVLPWPFVNIRDFFHCAVFRSNFERVQHPVGIPETLLTIEAVYICWFRRVFKIFKRSCCCGSMPTEDEKAHVASDYNCKVDDPYRNIIQLHICCTRKFKFQTSFHCQFIDDKHCWLQAPPIINILNLEKHWLQCWRNCHDHACFVVSHSSHAERSGMHIPPNNIRCFSLIGCFQARLLYSATWSRQTTHILTRVLISQEKNMTIDLAYAREHNVFQNP